MKPLKAYLKVLIFVFVSIVFSLNGYSVIWHSGAGTGYGDGGGDGTNEQAVKIEKYIIKGAGSYLAANSDFQRLLHMVELMDMQGADTQKMLTTLENSITKMKTAITTFDLLIRKAEATPYNETFIDKLRSFDYSLFMEANSLNKHIFVKAANRLKEGDITGTFKESYSRMQSILEMMKRVREDISMDNLPAISIFWAINEAFAETSLFGICAARVFHALDKNKIKIKVEEKNNATLENVL